MGKGIVGRKLGMTQLFDEEGRVVPVTVIEAGPCPVVQVKTPERDGYSALQVAFQEVRRVNRPLAGHFRRAGVRPARVLREVPVPDGTTPRVGDVLRVDMFSPGEKVDVRGISIGKGFQGGVRRHGFGRGPMSHGSKYHRGPGSLSPRMSGGGGRVRKGRRMPGHMGAVRVTVQNLTVVRVDTERNLLLVKGAVPGPRGATVTVLAAAKGGRRGEG